MVTSTEPLVEFAVHVVERAGRCVRELREAKTIEQSLKDSGRELVTTADLASDELIREAIREFTPGARYVSEEGVLASPIDWNEPTWVVDPIDGTVNYVYGHTHVGISLAYVIDGEVQVGVVHAPFQGETFVAVRGGGATLNGVALEQRATVPLANALVATGFPHDHADIDEILARLGRVVRSCRDLRRLASPALDICWVAAGRLDAAYETLRPWDVAAAGLVAREASVLRGHYRETSGEVPPEVCGEDVAFARAGLLEPLLSVLRGQR